MTNRSLNLTLMMGLLSLAIAGPLRAQTYTVTTMGPVGTSVIRPFAVNDLGQAVGQSSATSGTASDWAFLYEIGNPTAGVQILPRIAARPELTRSQANSINHSGQVVGYCETPTSAANWSASGFLWDKTNGTREIDQIADSSGNTAASLGYTIDLAYTINASGDILCFSNSKYVKCIWHMAMDPNGVQTLSVTPVPDISGSGQYTDLNVQGVVLIQGTNPTTGRNSFGLWDSSTSAFQAFIDPSFTQGSALNNYGVAVSKTGLIYRPGSGVASLGNLGNGSTYASDVNDLSQVVGYSVGKNAVLTAFFWQNGAIADLRTLTNAGSTWHFSIASSASNPSNAAGTAGYIVGWGSYKNQAAGWILAPK